MVVNFNGHALLLDQRAHFGADIGKRIHRRNGEVAALHAIAVTEVAALHVETRRPRRFFRSNAEEARTGLMIPLHAVKDEEFGFGAEESGVTDTRRLQIAFRTVGDRARVALVALTCRGFENVAGQNQRIGFTERIHARRVRIRLQQHVGRFDAAPADEGRAVKGLTELESVFRQVFGRNRHMHFLAEHVGETKVDELGVVVLNHLQNVSSGSHVCFSWKYSPRRSNTRDAHGCVIESGPTQRNCSASSLKLVSNLRAKLKLVRLVVRMTGNCRNRIH